MLTLPYRLFPLLPTSSTEVSKKWSLRSKIIWRGNYLLSFTISLRNPFISSLQHCINITMLSSITINYNFLCLSVSSLSSGAKNQKALLIHHLQTNSSLASFCILFIKGFLKTEQYFFLSLSFMTELASFILHTPRHSQKTIVHSRAQRLSPGDLRVNNSTHKHPFYKTSFSYYRVPPLVTADVFFFLRILNHDKFTDYLFTALFFF